MAANGQTGSWFVGLLPAGEFGELFLEGELDFADGSAPVLGEVRSGFGEEVGDVCGLVDEGAFAVADGAVLIDFGAVDGGAVVLGASDIVSARFADGDHAALGEFGHVLTVPGDLKLSRCFVLFDVGL
jgi:hypothetical protein